jgi:hypothetical protein
MMLQKAQKRSPAMPVIPTTSPIVNSCPISSAHIGVAKIATVIPRQVLDNPNSGCPSINLTPHRADRPQKHLIRHVSMSHQLSEPSVLHTHVHKTVTNNLRCDDRRSVCHRQQNQQLQDRHILHAFLLRFAHSGREPIEESAGHGQPSGV